MVYLVASVQGYDHVTAVDDRFCFTAIDGGRIFVDMPRHNPVPRLKFHSLMVGRGRVSPVKCVLRR